MVAVPCYNEAVTIVKVIQDFQKVLPNAEIHVFDNNSSDESAQLAGEAGAMVHFVPQQGKGDRRGRRVSIFLTDEARREQPVHSFIVGQRHPQLLQVVAALRRAGALTRLLDRRKQQRDQHADDRHHYQQLDQRETRTIVD